MAEKNGIQVSAGFDLKSRSFLDIRQSFETLNELVATPESQVPNGFVSFCEEDGKYYQFLAANEDSATGKWRVWMGSAAEAEANNGKIKIDDSSDLQYISEAIDGTTIVVDTDEEGNKSIKAKSLDGLLATIDELNHLQGLDQDIVDVLDAIGNPMNFKGVLANDDALAGITEIDDGDMYIITSSASLNDGGPVVVVAYDGEFKKIANVEFDLTGYLDKDTYAATDENGDVKPGVVKTAETIEGIDPDDLQDILAAAGNLKTDGDGTKYLNDKGEYDLIDADAVVTSDTEPENKKALWNHVQGTEGNYTYTLKYWDGEEWIAIVNSEGSLDVIDREDPTTVAMGDIKAGTILTGLNAIEVLIKAMYAYRKPEFTSFTSTPGTELRKVGTEISSVSLSATTKKVSKAITKVEFYKGTDKLEEITDGVASGGTYTHTYSTPIQLNTPGSVSFTAKVSDEDNTVTSSARTYEFIYPMYWGYTGNSPSEKLQKKGEINLTQLNPIDNSVFVMYPASYGDIKSIKDPNNFEVIDTFTKTTQNVTVVTGESEVSYNVYTSPRATNTDFSYKFTF